MVINKGNYIAQCKKGTDSMNEEKIKRMLDACYLAKRTRELLPELPEGVTPAYIQYMDVIHKLQEKKERVKVSDISDTLKLPRPGVTRTVKEMEKKGYLTKYASEEDGRNHTIRFFFGNMIHIFQKPAVIIFIVLIR